MIALLAIGLPLALLMLLAAPGLPRRLTMMLAPWSALILLWPALDPGAAAIKLEWPLMKMHLDVDIISQPLLLLTAVTWTAAGLFGAATIHANRTWFWTGWLGSLTGMSLLLLAADVATFYIGYATLSLAAYLLVTHAHDREAWRAGRVYLVMALMGEAAILAGVLFIAAQLGNVGLGELAEQTAVLMESPARWLLLAGFAVKMGIVPLHMWLPLAHPAAPVPASAILSGVIVKAGLMGWLRLAPPSALEAEWLGLTLLSLGLFTVFAGAALGLAQSRIKTVLAYSTISQMGLVLCAFALLYIAPERADFMLPAIGLLVLHHGLNKASLFLACGSQPALSGWRMALVALPALSIAAAPLTTGFIAKGWLKAGAEQALPDGLWVLLITLTSTASALIMWRVWSLARNLTGDPAPLRLQWVVLTLVALTLPWIWALSQNLIYSLTLVSAWSASWPVLIAVVALITTTRVQHGKKSALPEGDLVVPVEKLIRSLVSRMNRLQWPRSRASARAQPVWNRPLAAIEKSLCRLPVAGLMMLLIGALVWLSAWAQGSTSAAI